LTVHDAAYLELVLRRTLPLPRSMSSYATPPHSVASRSYKSRQGTGDLLVLERGHDQA
jgi:hypothetical protein